jgi:glycosyltransferase involved in cell wall biosynthesis
MHSICGIILTYNEEKNIQDAILNLKKVADSIFILDSFSTDKTESYALELGAKVVKRPWTNWVEARNYAMEQVAENWVLFLDADERMDTKLIESILKEKNKDEMYPVYAFLRRNFIGQKPILFGNWNPDTKPRLFDKAKAKWSGSLVHEKLSTEGIKPNLLNGELLHYSYKEINGLKHKAQKYGELAAQSLVGKSWLKLVIGLFFSPIIRFVKGYVFKRGFLDGLEGVAIAYYNTQEVFIKYSKAIKKKTLSK